MGPRVAYGIGQLAYCAPFDPANVAEAIVRVVNAPFGSRSYRVHVDPSHDGAEVVAGVGDRVRAELLRRIGLEDLLTPRPVADSSSHR